jgi:hypothetical protein
MSQNREHLPKKVESEIDRIHFELPRQEKYKDPPPIAVLFWNVQFEMLELLFCI